MKCNVGGLDRAIRMVFGVSFCVVALLKANIVAAIAGIILLFTAITRWCIPYQFLGINTGYQLKKGRHKNITSSLVEGFTVSLILYILVLLAYLIWKYIQSMMQ